jgi:hypothetical protein
LILVPFVAGRDDIDAEITGVVVARTRKRLGGIYKKGEERRRFEEKCDLPQFAEVRTTRSHAGSSNTSPSSQSPLCKAMDYSFRYDSTH